MRQSLRDDRTLCKNKSNRRELGQKGSAHTDGGISVMMLLRKDRGDNRPDDQERG